MMTRMVPMLLATGLVAAGMSYMPTAQAADVADDAVVVTLKVPNMT